jgi:hypothetical protein
MPDPEEPLSILSSPAPGLPFLWLCYGYYQVFASRD